MIIRVIALTANITTVENKSVILEKLQKNFQTIIIQFAN